MRGASDLQGILVCLLALASLSCTASGQLIIGECKLVQVYQRIGSCSDCPPGGMIFENCTEMEVTLNQYCIGGCVWPWTCTVTAQATVEYYWHFTCLSNCDDPFFPSCEEPGFDDVLETVLPLSCGCLPT